MTPHCWTGYATSVMRQAMTATAVAVPRLWRCSTVCCSGSASRAPASASSRTAPWSCLRTAAAWASRCDSLLCSLLGNPNPVPNLTLNPNPRPYGGTIGHLDAMQSSRHPHVMPMTRTIQHVSCACFAHCSPGTDRCGCSTRAVNFVVTAWRSFHPHQWRRCALTGRRAAGRSTTRRATASCTRCWPRGGAYPSS